MDARGEIYWSPNGNPRRKIYFDDSLGIPVQDVWTDYRDAHNQNIRITGYPTEKPPALLERIISASSNEGDLVLDCFVGSGTATAVAEKLGRKWVGIDKSPMAIEMSIKRLTQGTDRMGDFVQARQKVEAETLFDEHLLRESERIKPNLTGFRLFADPGMLAEAERSGLVARWRRFL
jgi:adenine-specific DNA-methyltransferase